MSAPDTNIEKQTKRHIGPLGGIALALVTVGLLYFGYVAFLSANGTPPEGAAVQIDGRTGEAVAAE